MPLATDIYVKTNLSPKEVYDFFKKEIGDRSDGLFVQAETTLAEDGTRCLKTTYGQGLPSELDVYYEKNATNLKDWREEWLEDDAPRLPMHNVHITLTTAYGYGDNMGGCTELHARLIVDFYRALLQPLAEDLYWNNEYSDTLSKNFEGMDEFLTSGDEKVEWFTNSVMPMIANIQADPEVLHQIFE